MKSFSPGTLLAGRFHLLRRLGTGGLAEVFAARDRVTGQEVAVKTLHGYLAREKDVAERFRREMTVTRGLDHPGIVRVYDLHEEEGRPFFTMELLEGETLAERLKRGRLEPQDARRIAREACVALRVAHRKGVVHRDLKPANLFLTDAGEVKLLDFGLARVAGWARLTAQSTVMGTPGYLAPELLGGSGADARADLYALGATLFEMFTGKRAFPGSDPYAVLRRQREGAPSPAALAPHLSEPDDRLVRRALDPDPERRFLDVGQLLRALSGVTVPAAPPAPPAMTAGKFDVVVHHAPLQGRALRRVFRALGIERRAAWGGRLSILGTNMLASGASRATAEALTAICQEQGVGTALLPHRPRRVWERFLDKFAPRIAGALGLGVLGYTGWIVLYELYFRFLGSGGWRVWESRPGHFEWIFVAVAAFAGLITGTATFFSSWALLGLSAGPPISQLPEGDPGVRRLMDGIARRMERLREARKSAKPASQMILDEILEACEPLQAVAAQLAERAASIDDPLAGPEALPIGPGEAAARDAALERLLEMAAALDDALAAAEEKSGPGAEALLAQLRAETSWARGALPGLDAAGPRPEDAAARPRPDDAAAAADEPGPARAAAAGRTRG